MYVPLRVFSSYSLHDSVINIKALIKQSQELQLPALALTDRSNMFAMVNFYKKALAAGIKPILSASLVLNICGKKVNCAVYCQNIQGFEDLSKKSVRYLKINRLIIFCLWRLSKIRMT